MRTRRECCGRRQWFEAKVSRLGNVIGRRDLDHDPAAVGLLAAIVGDLCDGLNRQPIAGLFDFGQLPAGLAVTLLGRSTAVCSVALEAGTTRTGPAASARAKRRDGCQDEGEA